MNIRQLLVNCPISKIYHNLRIESLTGVDNLENYVNNASTTNANWIVMVVFTEGHCNAVKLSKYKISI